MPRFAVIAGLFAAALVAATPAGAQTLLDRAREAVKDAGETVEEAAREAGRDVSDFLVDNPDLNRDLVDLGKRLGLPGFEDARPESGAGVVAAPSPTAPGAEMRLAAVGLPGSADIVIAGGPSVNDAVEVATARSTEGGTLQTTVTVPEEAEPGSELLFIVETRNGRVRLVSEPVTVVADDDIVRVTGTLSKEGVTCAALRGDDGILYTLATEDLGAFGPGDRVTVEGTVAEVSICNQGTTLSVIDIAAAN